MGFRRGEPSLYLMLTIKQFILRVPHLQGTLPKLCLVLCSCHFIKKSPPNCTSFRPLQTSAAPLLLPPLPPRQWFHPVSPASLLQGPSHSGACTARPRSASREPCSTTSPRSTSSSRRAPSPVSSVGSSSPPRRSWTGTWNLTTQRWWALKPRPPPHRWYR